MEITSSVQFRDGKFVNTRCFTVDVSDLVNAKASLRHKDEQLRQVLDALPAAVYTTDPKGKITYYNRAAAELAGREPEVGKDDGASLSAFIRLTARCCPTTNARWP